MIFLRGNLTDVAKSQAIPGKILGNILGILDGFVSFFICQSE